MELISYLVVAMLVLGVSAGISWLTFSMVMSALSRKLSDVVRVADQAGGSTLPGDSV